MFTGRSPLSPYCQTPVLGLGLGVDFTFAGDNQNHNNQNHENDNNPHLNFVKGTVLGKSQQISIWVCKAEFFRHLDISIRGGTLTNDQARKEVNSKQVSK